MRHQKYEKFVSSEEQESPPIIYEGICTCKKSYIGEMKRNVEIRSWEAKY